MSTEYKKRGCEPRPCRVCGEIFTPAHGNRKLCDDCRIRISNNLGLEWAVTYEGPVNVEEHERKLEKQNRERYKDKIIAIGYAERQMAEALRKAGKVKVEL